MDDEDKNRFDALAAMWKQSWESRDKRRGYEWRAAFGVWGAFVLLLGAMILQGNSFPSKPAFVICFAVLVIITVIVHILWLRGCTRANRVDSLIAWQYERQMRKMVNVNFGIAFNRKLKYWTGYKNLKKIKGKWSPRGQYAITIILALAALIILASKLVK